VFANGFSLPLASSEQGNNKGLSVVDSVLSAGLQGIQSGVNAARQAAEDIGRATTTATSTDNDEVAEDITEAAVELKISERQVQASATVVKTADEVLGTLLDTSA
jgi:glutamine synthetase